MPTPEFILELRKKIGHDLLWLMGVSGYVEDEQGRVLLGKRSDTGEWAMVYGINAVSYTHLTLPAKSLPTRWHVKSKKRLVWMLSSPIWCR